MYSRISIVVISMATSFWRNLILGNQNHLANMGKVNSTLCKINSAQFFYQTMLIVSHFVVLRHVI